MINVDRLRETALHHGKLNTTLELGATEVMPLLEVIDAVRTYLDWLAANDIQAPGSAPLAAALSRLDFEP